MRSHAKAPSAGSVWIAAVSAFLLSLLVLAAASDRASAVAGRPLLEIVPTTPNATVGAMATDAAGDFYISRSGSGNFWIEKVDAAGNPVDFTASASYISGNKLIGTPQEPVQVDALGGDIAVSKSNGYIYVPLGTTTRTTVQVVVFVYDPSGTYLGSLPGAQNQCGVGIAPTGDVYLTNLESSVVPRYEVVPGDPANDVLNGRLKNNPGLDYQPSAGGCSIEVDSTGSIYYGLTDGRMMKYQPSEVSPPTGPMSVATGVEFASVGGRTSALAIDPSNDNVFFEQGERGSERASSGAVVAEYNGLGGSAGAVFLGGKLYVSRTSGGLLVFGAPTQLPIVKTEGVSNLLPGGTTLNGEVDPDSAGNVTSCEFKYGLNQQYSGGSAPCSAGLPITTATGVSAEISGLEPGATYHYQLVAENGNGLQLGADQTFTTPPAVEGVATGEATEISRTTALLHGSFVGRGEDVHYYFEYGTSLSYGQTAPAPPGNDAGSVSGPQEVGAVPLAGLQGGTKYHYRLAATNVYGKTVGEDLTFDTPPAVVALNTGPVSGVTNTSAELHGSLEADSYEAHYYFEWGSTTSYGNVTPVPPGIAVAPGSGNVDLPPVTISGLAEGLRYHYRIVATNQAGITYGADASFRSAEAPLVSNLNTRNVQATSAELSGDINPRWGQASYFFEWGETAAYGNKVPVTPGNAGAGDSPVSVNATIEGLTPGRTYHFRLVASNQYGTTTSTDQTFGFYPPACPNAQLRQETRSNDLPDCRAYELVTPSFAQGTTIMPLAGPTSGVATNPPRLAYGGTFGLFPESTGEPMNGLADLYVSTRTDGGWTQRYIGLTARQGIFMGGPPGAVLPSPNSGATPSWGQRGVQATPNLDRVIDYNWYYPGNVTTHGPPASNAPYVWDATSGSFLERWPSNLGEVTGGESFIGYPRASGDFSHFVFSSNVVFAEGGVASPGKGGLVVYPDIEKIWPREYVYDNDLTTGMVVLASREADGTPFEGRAFDVSEDGSHILMTDEATLPGKEGSSSGKSVPIEPKEAIDGSKITGPLYLRVDGTTTYEIAPGHTLQYAGSTADGATVYVTSDEQLTSEDHDSSRDLYVWRESEPSTLKLVSLGDHGSSGDTDACSPNEGWTKACSISTIALAHAGNSFGPGGKIGQSGTYGNGITDNYLSAKSGDIYFESPEQLVGQRGEPSERNLYLYRGGSLRYVTTMKPKLGIQRIQATPDGKYMAFSTGSSLTDYNTGGNAQMYRYGAENGQLVCASCRPDNQLPVSGVLGSQNGLFLANDGRVFYSTSDPLVPRDTNQAQDVYEYTEGKPQLITTGSGTGVEAYLGGQNQPGLVNVSANGTDVYFASVDTLVTQDHNGSSIKIYDARTGGGFPAEREEPGCVAADECHGAGASPPPLPADRTSAGFGTPRKAKAHKAKKHKKAHKHKKHKKKKQAGKAKRKSGSAKQGGKRHG